MNAAPARPLRIAVTGATGLIGAALTEALTAEGHEVLRLVRRSSQDPEREISWDPEQGKIDAGRLAGVDAVVHLAGESIANGRWTAAKKARIRDSRIQSTNLLAGTLAALDPRPEAFLSGSAIGYYGDRGDEPLDEDSPPGNGFLADVCRTWEAATRPAAEAGIRVVALRTGVVLSDQGGALAKMLTPFKLGAGGIVGSGRQWMSWITLRDEVAAIRFLLQHRAAQGPVNLVSPQPVTNREFTKTLGHVLRRPTLMPLPAFAARLAFGEMADELLLGSAKIYPKRLIECGFQFQHPEIDAALRDVLS